MSIAADMLRGAANIAEHIGFDVRDIYRCHETGELPTFKVGRHICARKSELDERLSGRASAAK